jgi:hypothetical protein
VAQAQALTGVDLQALPLPLSSKPASMIESSEEHELGSFAWSFRTSGLSRPLSIRYPTPAPEGATASVVSGVVLSEFTTILGLGDGFDAALGFGAHLHQSGPSSTPAENGTATSFAARDPRIGLGYAGRLGHLRVRPFAQVYLPVGDDDAFAGEKSARGKFGTALGLTHSRFSVYSEISFIARRKLQISAATWGPQLILGTGASVRVYRTFSAQAEIVLLPVLLRQTTLTGEAGGYLLPAEVLPSLSYTWGRFSWGLGAGSGLPITRSSPTHLERKFVRAPTAPTYRAFADMTLTID